MAAGSDAWNEFVERACVAATQDGELAPLYARWVYHSEVCNGGHHQYFENCSDRPGDWDAAVSGARLIGETEVADNLAVAMELWRRKPRHPAHTAAEFLKTERDGELEGFDDRFFELEAGVHHAFEAAVVPKKTD